MDQRRTAAVVLLTLMLVVLAFVAGLFRPLIVREIARGGYDQEVRERIKAAASDQQLQASMYPVINVIARVKGEHLNHWCGIEVRQYPQDLILYQELMDQIRPDVVIESGTLSGGLTLFLSAVMAQTNPEGKVITIDIDSRWWDKTLADLKQNRPAAEPLLGRIHFVKGSSVDPATIKQVEALIPPKAKVLVILDSLHTKDHVLKELTAYAPLVSVGSYLILNDTDLDGSVQRDDPSMAGHLEERGAGEAVRQWLPANPNYQDDAKVDRFAVTCARGGFLKRVK